MIGAYIAGKKILAMRSIDNFKPSRPWQPHRSPQTPRPKGPLIDVIKRPRRKISTQRQLGKQPNFSKVRAIQPSSVPMTTGLKIERPHTRLKKTIITGLLILVAILGITTLTRQPLGFVLVMGYGLFAFIRQISSRVTLTVALVMITLIPISLFLLGGRNVLSSALASYAFLLLAIGMITEWRALKEL